MKNVEVAKKVLKALNEKGVYWMSFEKILDDLDCSNPNETIKKEDVKDIIDGFLSEAEYIDEEYKKENEIKKARKNE